MLTHQSGLNHNNGGDYDLDSLRSYIQLGVVAAEKATYQYQNGNFALFRVAIPYLRYGAAGVDLMAAIWGVFGSFEEVIAGLYIGTVNDYALNPTGVIQAKCKPNDAKQTLLYRFPDDGSEGFQNGDWTLLCGSGGWYMSSVELAGFMAFRRFSNVMMTPTARNTMDNGFLGWMSGGNYDWPNGEHGLYRSHGGDRSTSTAAPRPRRLHHRVPERCADGDLDQFKRGQLLVPVRRTGDGVRQRLDHPVEPVGAARLRIRATLTRARLPPWRPSCGRTPSRAGHRLPCWSRQSPDAAAGSLRTNVTSDTSRRVLVDTISARGRSTRCHPALCESPNATKRRNPCAIPASISLRASAVPMP